MLLFFLDLMSEYVNKEICIFFVFIILIFIDICVFIINVMELYNVCFLIESDFFFFSIVMF